MKAKNHNTNREKRVMKKRFRTAVFLLLFAGIVLTVFRYFKLVSKTVYEESVSHLTEVFHQSDNMLRAPVQGEGEELQIAAQIRGGFGNLQMKLAVTGNIKHRTGFIHLPVGRVRQ